MSTTRTPRTPYELRSLPTKRLQHLDADPNYILDKLVSIWSTTNCKIRTVAGSNIDLLVSNSKPSSFGRGDQTVFDPDYRSERDIVATDLTLGESTTTPEFPSWLPRRLIKNLRRTIERSFGVVQARDISRQWLAQVFVSSISMTFTSWTEPTQQVRIVLLALNQMTGKTDVMITLGRLSPSQETMHYFSENAVVFDVLLAIVLGKKQGNLKIISWRGVMPSSTLRAEVGSEDEEESDDGEDIDDLAHTMLNTES